MKKLLLFLVLAFVAFPGQAQRPASGSPHRAATSTKLGDVNADNTISIADATLMVAHLLEQDVAGFVSANADVNKDGRISVSDAVSIIKIIVEGDPEPQAYLTCPDNHHPHIIDLGLPSGTKWSCSNVGADKPEGYGGYYAWGETEEKITYNWSTYIHCEGTQSTCHDLGSDIAGTQYDVAHVKWGGAWVMPSNDQLMELRDYCNKEWTTVNGVKGLKITSKINGGSIFLPAAGRKWYDGVYPVGEQSYYWSATLRSSYSTSHETTAYSLKFYMNYMDNSVCYVASGHSVRPVWVP